MTPRSTINFFRSRTGAFILFLALLVGGYYLVEGVKAQPHGQATTTSKQPGNSERKPQIVETVTRDMTAYNPPKESAPTAVPILAATPVPAKKQEKPPELPPISLFAEYSGAEKQTEQLSNDYAPFGRLVQCELVVTVDSSSINTPIIGLVTEDVWHDGRLIIPAGAEVHGTAKLDRVRERIASNGN